jgi:hypothetical protein
MSDSSPAPRAPGFLWLLAILAGLVVVMLVLPQRSASDPRDLVRADNKAEIAKIHAPNLAKMGLEKGKSTDALTKGAGLVKGQPAAASAVAVPGSPTQLKQAAAAAPAPAAPAPAPAPEPAK